MSLTENPIDIVSTRNSGNFTLGNHALRTSWQNSFWIPPTSAAATMYLTDNHGNPLPFLGYGTVVSSANGLTTGVGLINQGTVTGFQQLYIIDTFTGSHVAVQALAAQCSSLNPSFPVGSIPLCVLVVDAVGRIQQVIDFRPSNLSSAPNLGSGMTESISGDVTKRINWVNNYYVPRTYALSATVPQEVNPPCSGFFLGAGAVVLSGQTISFPTTYISIKTQPLALAVNAISQFYVNPSNGAVAVQIPAVSGTFPANSLALCEVTTDSTGLIRNIVDFRPSYV